jgi:DNA-binding XRE family transcriptional regulator
MQADTATAPEKRGLSAQQRRELRRALELMRHRLTPYAVASLASELDLSRTAILAWERRQLTPRA